MAKKKIEKPIAEPSVPTNKSGEAPQKKTSSVNVGAHLLVSLVVLLLVWLVYRINVGLDKNEAKAVIDQYRSQGYQLRPRDIRDINAGVVQGYTFAANLLKNGFESQEKYGKTPYEDRWQYKLGFDAYYLLEVKRNTPDSAIILMPPADEFLATRHKNPFKKPPGAIVINRLYASRILYPRIVVQATDTAHKLYNKVTHVALINGWGHNMAQPENNQLPEYGVAKILKK